MTSTELPSIASLPPLSSSTNNDHISRPSVEIRVIEGSDEHKPILISNPLHSINSQSESKDNNITEGNNNSAISSTSQPIISPSSSFISSTSPINTWRKPDFSLFLEGRIEPPAKSSRKIKHFYEQQRELIDSYTRIHKRQNRIDSVAKNLFTTHNNNMNSNIDGRISPPSPGGSTTSNTKYQYVLPSVADAEHGEAEVEETDETPAIKRAINLSFMANICLFAVKIFAAAYSGSLAVIASAIDSSLDIVSGTIIYVAARMAAKKNPHLYPIGKAKLEPLAIIVFASVMGVASLQLMVQSIQDVVSGYMTSPPTLVVDEITYGVLAAVIITKAILYFICSRLADSSASVDALAQDHRNDVVTNSVTIAAVLFATRFPSVWVLDPVCAFVIAAIIVTNWAATGKDYIQQMTGKVADPNILSQLTFIALNYHPAIIAVDTVRAYHAGAKIYAEVDIVLPPNMPLAEAHDIGEGLTHMIEAEDYVERAFVHMDTESDHRAEDEHSYPW